MFKENKLHAHLNKHKIMLGKLQNEDTLCMIISSCNKFAVAIFPSFYPNALP